MKKIMLSAALLLCAFLSNAQESGNEPKTDFKRFYINASSDFTDEYSSSAFLGFEYQFKNESSVGISFSYRESKDVNNFYTPDLTNYGFQLQFNHDWSRLIGLNTNKFDLYTGLNFGLTRQEVKQGNALVSIYEDGSNFFTAGGQLGARYFFYKGLGVNVELNANSDFDGANIKFGSDPRIGVRTGLTYKF
ncbi:outer membrane beta-barrel protein [Flavobacterium sp.]|uniref:outer membrane beta-barrel protein n=1 Tax=Flavobacterium sp. TaxID=239 RepID=UPI0039E3A7FB